MAVETSRSAARARGRVRRRRRRRRGRGHRRVGGRQRPDEVRVDVLPAALPARSAGAALSRRRRPESQLPYRARVHRRRCARPAAGAARRARRRPPPAGGVERPDPLVHQGLQPLQLHARRPRRLGCRGRDRHRERRLVRPRRPARRGRLRRLQPPAARDHAAARPRAHVPRERPLLRDRARNRVRARRARRRRRGVRRVQSLAPAGPDRTARARAPLTLHRCAAARERGAVPDDVRVRADRDDARRRRRLGDEREPLARSAPGLHRGGAPRAGARRPRASGRPRERRREVRGADSRRQ